MSKGNKAYKEAGEKQKSGSKGQRRLTLAVLAVLVILSAGAGRTGTGGPAALLSSLLSEIGIVSEDTAGSPAESVNDEASSGGDAESPGGADAALPGEDGLPEYSGSRYVKLNGNKPVFPAEVYSRAKLEEADGHWKTSGSRLNVIEAGRLNPYEYYGELDSRGRCTAAYGCLGIETMPEVDEERGDISEIHPSGWAKGQSWERSHLIAWALGAENANPRNLVTGTHEMNNGAMRPFEEKVEHYIWNTGRHVLYMVRPWFSGDELVPRGVQMTAWSVEDEGDGISFNIYCFNVTPGATIDYMTGIVTTEEQANQDARKYIINTRSGTFHYPSCEGAAEMSQRNRREVTATRVELTSQGYVPCGACQP